MQQLRSRAVLAALGIALAFARGGDSQSAIGVVRKPSAGPLGFSWRAASIVSLDASHSLNWSGYGQGLLEKTEVITELGFQSVSGDWVVPTAKQHTGGEAEYSSAWVGIGGGCIEATCTLSDVPLVQVGTEQDVDASGDSYYSWWEAFPLPPFQASLEVKAGDLIHAEIKQLLPEIWTITIESSRGSFTTTVPFPADYSTAEWILEVPTFIGAGGTGLAALPDLGRVHFSNAKVNQHAADLVPGEAIQLVDANGNPIATPSDPSGGTAFDVCAYAPSCP